METTQFVGSKGFDTLYKRAKTGDIQFWGIAVYPYDKHSGSPADITKLSGKLGTDKPLKHVETISTGKNIGKSNETTPWQQALSQAESDWKKKRDDGYKSVAMLGLKPIDMTIHNNVQQPLYHIPGTPAQTGKPLELALEDVLPKFNTDANGNVKPMLAPTKPFARNPKRKYPQLLEKKLDGVRSTCIIDKSDESVEVMFLSRSGKPYDTLKHLQEIIMIEAASSDIFIPKGRTILDGEIYFHGWTLEEINEAVKKYRVGQTDKLEFWVFDVPLSPQKQDVRSHIASLIVKAIEHPAIQFEKAHRVDSDDEVIKLHDEWVNDGFEGGMLKDPEGTYQQGQRSSFWTKVKMFDDNEFELLYFEYGQRGAEDLIAVCKSPEGSTGDPEFRAKMQGTRETKLLLNQRYGAGIPITGKKLTVKHFGFSKYGIPNLPSGKAIRDYE